MPRIRLLLAVLGLLIAGAVQAQGGGSYPDRLIKLEVPFTAGGQFDLVARFLAQYASARLGRTVIVENIAGGGGNIGAAKVANAAPDGYTLLAMGGNHAVAKFLYARPGFELHDLTPIALVSASPHVVFANPDAPFKTMTEMIDYARKNPGKLSYASPGIGTSMHVTFEMIKAHYGLDITHVPYRGGANAMNDVAAGQVPIGIVAPAAAAEFIKAGKLRALAVTSKVRSPALPDVPAMSEAGFPELNASSWLGVAGPKGLPPEVVNRWNEVIHAFQADPVNRKRLEAMGFRADPTTPAQFADFINSEAEAGGKVIRDNRISAD